MRAICRSAADSTSMTLLASRYIPAGRTSSGRAGPDTSAPWRRDAPVDHRRLVLRNDEGDAPKWFLKAVHGPTRHGVSRRLGHAAGGRLLRRPRAGQQLDQQLSLEERQRPCALAA